MGGGGPKKAQPYNLLGTPNTGVLESGELKGRGPHKWETFPSLETLQPSWVLPTFWGAPCKPYKGVHDVVPPPTTLNPIITLGSPLKSFWGSPPHP